MKNSQLLHGFTYVSHHALCLHNPMSLESSLLPFYSLSADFSCLDLPQGASGRLGQEFAFAATDGSR